MVQTKADRWKFSRTTTVEAGYDQPYLLGQKDQTHTNHRIGRFLISRNTKEIETC